MEKKKSILYSLITGDFEKKGDKEEKNHRQENNRSILHSIITGEFPEKESKALKNQTPAEKEAPKKSWRNRGEVRQILKRIPYSSSIKMGENEKASMEKELFNSFYGDRIDTGEVQKRIDLLKREKNKMNPHDINSNSKIQYKINLLEELKKRIPQY